MKTVTEARMDKLKPLFEFYGAMYPSQIIEAIKWDEHVPGAIQRMIDEGFIEKVRVQSGAYVYRIPVVKPSEEEFKPREGVLKKKLPMSAVERKAVTKVLDELDEFTVNQFHQSLVKKSEGFKLTRVKSIMAELLEEGIIEAVRARKYMGRQYEVYARRAG